jgi:hypothetical protein
MFSANVDRWRSSARYWAAWAALRFKVELSESDVLALIYIESKGDPTVVSPTGYRGLGQVGQAALKDYNDRVDPELRVEWPALIDADRGNDQIRVVAWHMARGRSIVSSWSMADAASNAARWADVRYAWGGGHLKSAVASFIGAHGHRPTFAELAAELPDAGAPNVAPWRHANLLVELSSKDSGIGLELPTSKKKMMLQVVVGAAAFMGLALVAIGIARLVSR